MHAGSEGEVSNENMKGESRSGRRVEIIPTFIMNEDVSKLRANSKPTCCCVKFTYRRDLLGRL